MLGFCSHEQNVQSSQLCALACYRPAFHLLS